MGKYEPLEHFLKKQRTKRWRVAFREIEAMLGFKLPQSAFKYPAWWSNDETGHSHAKAWLDAGWRTEEVDLALAKIDQGTYGRCDHCGERIPRARLEALPAAQLCLDCKGNPRGHGLSTLSHRRHRPTTIRR